MNPISCSCCRPAKYYRYFLLTGLFFLLAVFLLHGQNYQFAKSIEGTGEEQANSIITDPFGNLFLTGFYSNSPDFDPGPGATILSSSGGKDIFLAKYDITGNFLWAIGVGGSGNDEGQNLAVDGAGNIYITGFFFGTVDFDPGAGIHNLTSAGLNDIFIAKFNSTGELVWANRIGSSTEDIGYDIALGSGSDIVVTGYFTGVADFDPGVGSAMLTSTGGFEIFLAKFDEDGNYIWADQIGGTGLDIGFNLVTDASDNIFLAGLFSSTADFDPGAGLLDLTSAGDTDAFFSKYDTDGNLVWAGNIGGSGTDSSTGVDIDNSGNVFVTGTYTDNADFDPGASTVTLTSTGSRDGFIAKYNSSGDYQWANSLGGSTIDDFTYGLAVAGSEVLVTGYFSGTADFDPGISAVNLTSNGGTDIFIAWYDASGSFNNVIGIGGSTNEEGIGIALSGGNAILTGYFTGTVDFDPGTGIALLSSFGSREIFIAGYDPFVLPVELLYFKGSIKDDYNLLEWATETEFKNEKFIIERSEEGRIWKPIGQENGRNIPYQKQLYQFIDADREILTASMLYYRLRQVDFDNSFSLSDIIVLNRNDKSNTIVYPNPVKERVFVQEKGESEILYVDIFDLNGKRLLDIKPKSNLLEINLSNFEPGVYLLHIVKPHSDCWVEVIKE